MQKYKFKESTGKILVYKGNVIKNSYIKYMIYLKLNDTLKDVNIDRMVEKRTTIV